MVRRLIQVIALVGTLVVGVTAMAAIVSQTAWFKQWLRAFIVRQADDYVNGRLAIGRLDGNLFFGLELEDVHVTMGNERVVDVKDVGVTYDVFEMLTGRIGVDQIRINHPVIRVRKSGDTLNVLQILKVQAPTDKPKPPGKPLAIEEIGITDGQVFISEDAVGTTGVDVPGEIYKLDASVKVESDAGHLGVRINHLALRTASPRMAVNSVSGAIIRTKDGFEFRNVSLRTAETSMTVTGAITGTGETQQFDVHATSDKFSLPEIARLVPALSGIPLQPAFEVQARGPLSALKVDAEVRSDAGQIDATLQVDAAKPVRRIAGTVTMRGLDLAPLAKNPRLKSDLTAVVTADVRLPEGSEGVHGTYTVDGDRVAIAGYDVRNVQAAGRVDGQTVTVDGRAQAYGGRATVDGTVTTGTNLALDLRGQASGIDLRNLPKQTGAPAVPSRLTFAYHVRGTMPVIEGDVTMRESTIAGATLGDGTTASVRVGDGAPSYAATGTVRRLDVERIGRAFRIAALADPKYSSTINGRFAVKGRGTGIDRMQLDASGELVNSTMFGASFPRFNFTAGLANRTLTLSALGPFLNLDPAYVAGRPDLKGDVDGDMDLRATVRGLGGAAPIAPADVAADGRINLGRSTVAGLTIDTAAIDGRFDGATARLNQVAVKGPDLNVQAKGTMGVAAGTSSDLQYHVDTPTLDRIGTILGQPLRGAVVADGTITGPREQMAIDATVKGSNVGRADASALTLDSRLRVLVPNLDFAAANVDTTTTAQFLQVGGQKINSLDLKGTYADRTVTFDATAQEGVRRLNARGDVVLHPDHQEIHVGDLALRSDQYEWRTAPGAQAAVQYGKDRVAVTDVHLVSGNQSIEATGALGRPGDRLRLSMTNVDVAAVDKLLLLNQGIAGRLNADATISGPMNDPNAKGQFALTDGAFQQYKFQRIAGSVDYAKPAVAVDVRLDQAPEQYLTAKGRIPLTPPKPEARGQEVSAPGEAIDLQVASSRLDLGVVQGFTDLVSNVTGTLQANVHVGNTLSDPHLNGAVEIRNGAMTVPAAGETYSGIDTRIELTPELVKIPSLRIFDSHQHPLEISGQLAVHERRVGGMNVSIRSEDFKLVDNEFGTVHVKSDLRLTGELRAPRIEGAVEAVTANIDVAKVLEVVSAEPYATEATRIDPARPPEGSVPTTAGTDTGIMGPLAMDVTFSAPNDMILKGSDIRTAGAPIALGDVNMTVGANVHIRKRAGDTIRLTGNIVTVRGTYDFQGRRFEVLRDGQIRFTGLEKIDPSLDVTARRMILGIEALIHVRGTMTAPQISFTSNPPLDQADILSLVVFNQPVNQLGEGQQVTLAQRASSMATGYLASGLAQSLGKALALDIFEISAGDAMTGGGPSLTVGEQVGGRLFVKFRRGFGGDTANEFLLEYQLNDFLRLQSAISDGSNVTRSMFQRQERGGIDVVWFFSY